MRTPGAFLPPADVFVGLSAGAGVSVRLGGMPGRRAGGSVRLGGMPGRRAGVSVRRTIASGRMLKWPEATQTCIVRKTGRWARTWHSSHRMTKRSGWMGST